MASYGIVASGLSDKNSTKEQLYKPGEGGRIARRGTALTAGSNGADADELFMVAGEEARIRSRFELTVLISRRRA